MIRPFRPEDQAALHAITAEVFGPSAIDFHIEGLLGPVRGHDWAWRKNRNINEDIRSNPTGIFVFEEEGAAGADTKVVGYITVVIDREAGIGRIPNLAVTAAMQGRGIGRKLIQHALDYMREQGLEVAKIETLVGNAVGEKLYPSMGFQEISRQIHFVMKL